MCAVVHQHTMCSVLQGINSCENEHCIFSFFLLREHPIPHASTKMPSPSPAVTDLVQRLGSVRVDHKDHRAGALVHVYDPRVQHRQGSSASTCWPKRKKADVAKV